MVGWWKSPPQDPSAPTCPDVGSILPIRYPRSNPYKFIKCSTIEKPSMVTIPCIHFTHVWRVLSVRAFEGNDRFHNVPTSYEKKTPLPMVGWWKSPPQDPSAPTCPDVGSILPIRYPRSNPYKFISSSPIEKSSMVTIPCIHFTHFWRVLSVRAFEGNDRFHNVPTSYEKKNAAANGWIVETAASRSQRPNMSWCWLNFTHSISQIKHI